MKQAVLTAAQQDFTKNIIQGAFDEVGSLQDLMADYFAGDISLDELTSTFDDAMDKIEAAMDEEEFQKFADVLEELGLVASESAQEVTGALSSFEQWQAKLKTQFEDIFGEASLGTQIEAAGIAGTDLESILQGLPEGLEASTEAAREYGHQILDSAKNTENAQAALDIFSKVLAEIADDLENLKQMKGTGVNIREILGLDFVPRYLKQSILGENADLGLNWDQKTGEGLIDNFNRLNELLKEGTIESQEYSSFMSHFIDKEQELSQARKSSIDSIDSLLQRLKGSELSPVQSMEHYEQRYENLLGRAEESRGTAGFADAISDLTSFVPEMLEYAGAYGGNYKELYNSVMQTIENMRPVDQGMMRPIDEGRTDTGQGFVSSTVYTRRLADYYNRIGYDYQGVTDWTPFKVLDAIKTTGMSLEEHASKYLSRDSFKDKLGLPLYASGGYHDGGWRVVGERGPELEFTQPSSIVSSKESKKMLQEAVAEGLAAAGGSGNGDVVVKVYVGTNELKDYHVEWHRSDEETHEAVRREAR
jgi:polyhydroxyalkanoate synthesis regulator phasin